MNLTLLILNLILWEKIILLIFVVLLFLALWKLNKPWVYASIITAAFLAFYLVLSWPLQKMFWGNHGDESYILAFLEKVLNGQYSSDFFYGWLPPFYPPLYFWVTGTVARLFTTSAVVAAKIGVLGVIGLWFLVPLAVQKIYWKKEIDGDLISTSWFYLLAPLIFLISLDFENIITKPYEAISAMLAVILVGLFAEALTKEKWRTKEYLLFGISGGLLFLIFYFWWVILVPVLLVLALSTKPIKKNILRLVLVGAIILVISLPYTLPLVLAAIKYGVESWQAIYFYAGDLVIFMPWMSLSLTSVLSILGLVGLIFFRKNKFIKSSLYVLIGCYLYQFINIMAFALGQKPVQASKPFLFLGTAALSCGAAYFIIYIFKLLEKHQGKKVKLLAAALIVLFLPLTPFVKLIDNKDIQQQLQSDLTESYNRQLANYVKQSVPDYKDHTWLCSGGVPELNGYLTLSYYIYSNPHFSHQSVIYSKRFAEIQALSKAQTPEEFIRLIDQGYPKKIDGLILYYNDKQKTYDIFFTQDNFPNGNREVVISLPRRLISEKYWTKAFDNGQWFIYNRK